MVIMTQADGEKQREAERARVLAAETEVPNNSTG